MEVKRVLFLLTWSFCLKTVISQSPVDIPYQIDEELGVGALVGMVAQDAKLYMTYDASVFQQLRYSFLNTDNPDNAYFSLSADSGVLSIAQEIDRDSLEQCRWEEKCFLRVQVAVSPAEYFQVIRITVEIKDLNDNVPRFANSFVTIKIPESVLINTPIYLTPAAVDPDSESFGIQSYEITPRTSIFSHELSTKIDGSVDLEIIVRQPLDREVQDFYQFRIAAKDGGVPPLIGWLTVNVIVTDVNDHTPQFENQSYAVNVQENIPVNSTIVHVRATDDDIELNGELFYYISPRAPWAIKSLFGINNKTGEIYTLKEVDYENAAKYEIPVLVRDHGTPGKYNATIVTVNVIDLNDNHPEIVINMLRQQISVSENSGNGTVVVPVTIFDKDDDKNGRVTCRLSSPLFALKHMYDAQYTIVLTEKLDYERKRKHNLTIWCEDAGEPKMTSMKRIMISVRDENDHAPEFAESLYVLTIAENNEIGDPVGEVKATDLDLGTNGEVWHSLSSHSDSDFFYIDRYSGLITARAVFNRENKDEFIFYVIAVDNSKQAKTNTATVVVSVMDKNDEAPDFEKNNYPFVIAENQSKLTIVGQVNATDRDLGLNGEVWYQIDPLATKELELFTIRPDTGEIYTTKVLDREEKAMYSFAVIASDKGSPMLSSSTVVSLELTDINDEAPRIEFPALPENDTISVSCETPVGIAVTQIIAVDNDIADNGRLTYFLHSGNNDNIFAIDPNTGKVIVKTKMDPENLDTYVITIGVHDNGKPQYTAYITVNFVVTNEPFVADFTSSPTGLHQNLIIVICLSSVAAVLVIVLVIAICWMRRQNRDGDRYNCRLEANKMLGTRGTPPPPSPSMKVSMQRNNHIEGSEEEGDSSISTISRGDIHIEKMGNGQVVTTFPAQNDVEVYNMNYMQSKAAPGLTVLPPGDRTFSPTPGHHHHDLQVNSMLGLLKREHRDSDSACSAEISNPDSGRGSSEVDIHSRSSRQSPNQVLYGDQHRGSKRSRSTPLLTQQQSRALQQNRELRNNPHNNTHCPVTRPGSACLTSPQTHLPVQRRFSGSSMAPPPAKYRHCSEQFRGPNEVRVHEPRGHEVRGHQRHSDYYPALPPSGRSVHHYNSQNHNDVGLPQNGEPYATYNRSSCHYNHPNRRRRKDLTGTMVHDESIEEISDYSDNDAYSCADIDGGLIDSRYRHDDDSASDASTTSGEYTVDADGLVDRIDNLFFQDMIV